MTSASGAAGVVADPLVEKKAMADADVVDAGDSKVAAVGESVAAAVGGHRTSSLAIMDALDVPVEQQAVEDLVLAMPDLFVPDLAAPVRDKVVVEVAVAAADDGHRTSSRAIVGVLNVHIHRQAVEDLVPAVADLTAPKQEQDVVEAAVADEV
jgi:hypothetical protein